LNPKNAVPGSVLLVPIGEVEGELLGRVRDDLAAAIGGGVTIEKTIPLSTSWYDEA
jgi:hypothetical protein